MKKRTFQRLLIAALMALVVEGAVMAIEQCEYLIISRHIAEQNDNPPVIQGPPITKLPDSGV